jgi:hypothetical protein
MNFRAKDLSAPGNGILCNIIRNNFTVLKCDDGGGWRRSVGPTWGKINY